MKTRFDAVLLTTLVALTGCYETTSLMVTTTVTPGEVCAAGGTVIEYGIDDDGDGLLSEAEVDGSSTLCHGSDGSDAVDGSDGSDGANGSLLALTDEPAGENCTHGGQRVDVGIDDDADGELDASEIDDTTYLCDRIDGVSDLVAVADEAPGENCTWGGKRIDTGSDVNADGVLDTEEIEDSNYVCDGADGYDTVMAFADEAAGENCTYGGQRVQTGLDADRDGLLGEGEVLHTVYLCDPRDGVDGEDGLNTLVSISVEAEGENCEWGGQRVDSGVDDDADGLLDAEEIDATDYVCDGADGLDSLIAASDEPSGDNCFTPGTKIEFGTDTDRDGMLDAEEVDPDATIYLCEEPPELLDPVTVDFRSFDTPDGSYPQIELADFTLSGSGDVRVHGGGLGVAGGYGDTWVDSDDVLVFNFNGPVMLTEYVPGNNGLNGSNVDLEAFGMDGNSLGIIEDVLSTTDLTTDYDDFVLRLEVRGTGSLEGRSVGALTYQPTDSMGAPPPAP